MEKILRVCCRENNDHYKVQDFCMLDVSKNNDRRMMVQMNLFACSMVADLSGNAASSEPLVPLMLSDWEQNQLNCSVRESVRIGLRCYFYCYLNSNCCFFGTAKKGCICIVSC